MSRPSRDTKREQQGPAPAALAAAPIDVHIPAAGTGAAAATIGGVPLTVADGEDVQQAVLGHLHRIALATGHPARATIHDDRLGCVVPLQVDPDGSSHLTGSPTPAPVAPSPAPAEPPTATPDIPSAPAVQAPRGAQDGPAGLLRQEPEPVRENVPTFSLRALSEPQPLGRHASTFPPRAVAESAAAPASTFAMRAVPERTPGTVAPPTGVFGPPPLMDAVPARPAPGAGTVTWPSPADSDAPEDDRTAAPAPASRITAAPDAAASRSTSSPGAAATSASRADVATRSSVAPLVPRLDPEPAPRSAPTPARGFDAVAEAVLGDEPPTAPGFLLEPMARVNEAVRSGRIAEADQLATKVVGEASAVLGLEHAEVLKLRELAAYIAYLAGEPVRAFRLSLDLARVHRGLGDAEGAYGNVQSAASAWRAVRDPEQGLVLGRDLIGLWSGLAAEGGPAAEEIERLESARTRMGRLAERARKSAR
ncbi:tetratricopeptide repeat protein [Streptomyces sp. NPDC059690]|uniref:tetratricopeptide repeat protein n=1 Tax=Streptomyces sp. NPDC059690 TaxID=3346907 RepID=UPI0036BC33ED